ncbi:MAG: integrase core domain-containing protein [Gemmatimonadaceae bacterium]
MPWLETAPVEERLRFIEDARSDRFSMAELCARYGVSRRVGYKWIERFQEEGRRGLQDRSRAPHHCPHRINPELAELLCAMRRAHPLWGARKLLTVLAKRHPEIAGWPAPSTAADLLARRGLVQRRRRRRPHIHPGVVPATTAEPNDLWTADFKGQFRTDNGVSFATQAIHGLSYLNVWWMRLGIQHQRILPGRPDQNGAHERMHRTLKRQVTRPVRRNVSTQQEAFDEFRSEYNTLRPHEWLNQDTPGSRYRSSLRPFPNKLPPLEYPEHFVVKKITTGGTFRFRHRLLYLANAMVDQHIGLEETDDGVWNIFFNTVLLATLDEKDYIIRG